MTTFDVSNKDLVNLFNKCDIEFVEHIESNSLIVQWKEKEDFILGYFIVHIHEGLLFCQAFYPLADNITDRNELLRTLVFPSDFSFLNGYELKEDNILVVQSVLLVGFGVSEATVAKFIEMFVDIILEIEGKLEELGIDFDNMCEEMYDIMFRRIKR